jgi:hypothetical protein
VEGPEVLPLLQEVALPCRSIGDLDLSVQHDVDAVHRLIRLRYHFPGLESCESGVLGYEEPSALDHVGARFRVIQYSLI